ncbi:MAG: ROK family protein [Candidatus Dormiibacterota bacterium]
MSSDFGDSPLQAPVGEPTEQPTPTRRPWRCLGIDVGGTKIAAGLLDEGGRFEELDILPTRRGDGGANLTTLRDLIRAAPAGLSAIGVSVRTLLDPAGALRDPRGVLGWRGVNLARELSVDGAEVTVSRDVECGAVAEVQYGAGQGTSDALYVTIGTGISHCLVKCGVPLSGAHGAASSGQAPPARCTRQHCVAQSVEQICSGPALASEYAGREAQDASDVITGAEAGESRAVEIISHAGWHLGAYLATLMLTLDPEIVVIGGGLGTHASTYREIAIGVARSVGFARLLGELPIVPASLGDGSAWIGAAHIAAMRLVDSAESAESGATRRNQVLRPGPSGESR